jgi:hypothetical protein
MQSAWPMPARAQAPGDADFMGPLNYAYHFDAGKFAALLSTHAQSLGVQHVQATVERWTRMAPSAPSTPRKRRARRPTCTSTAPASARR